MLLPSGSGAPLPDDVTVEAAQARLGTWCARRGDTRIRATADGKAPVATVTAP